MKCLESHLDTLIKSYLDTLINGLKAKRKATIVALKANIFDTTPGKVLFANFPTAI